MSDLRFNSIAGAVLASAMAVVGLGIVGETVFHPEFPAKPGYEIDTSATMAAGGGGATKAEEGPVDWNAILSDPAAVAAGEKVATKCRACHTFEKGGALLSGPNQWNLVGRPAGTEAGFTYSAAMKGYAQPWTYDNLDKFIASPGQDVKGTAMQFVGVKNPTERHALIAFLRSNADSPAPIPPPLPPKAEATSTAPPAAAESTKPPG
jgi:cytochrome c